MLYAFAALLLVLWLTGLVTSGAPGGPIDMLLVVAVVALVCRISRGKNVFEKLK